MPSRVTPQGLFWTGVGCTVAAVVVSFVPAFFAGNALGSASLVAFAGISTVLTVVRDFGVLAIVASLVLHALASPGRDERDDSSVLREAPQDGLWGQV